MYKKFSRPSITVGDAEAPKREWRDIPASEVSVGDLVTFFGTVAEIEKVDDPVHLHLTNITGDSTYVSPHEYLRAFVKVDTVG